LPAPREIWRLDYSARDGLHHSYELPVDPTVPQIQLRGGNVQVNDGSKDYVQTFTGFRPFVRATQSEVSSAAFGRNIVVTFNDSTGIHVSPNPNGPGAGHPARTTHRMRSHKADQWFQRQCSLDDSRYAEHGPGHHWPATLRQRVTDDAAAGCGRAKRHRLPGLVQLHKSRVR